jgi:hypothetical protein
MSFFPGEACVRNLTLFCIPAVCTRSGRVSGDIPILPSYVKTTITGLVDRFVRVEVSMLPQGCVSFESLYIWT